MATITLRYNPNNTLAKSIINSVKSAGVFQIAEELSPCSGKVVPCSGKVVPCPLYPRRLSLPK